MQRTPPKRKNFIHKDEPFICEQCGASVSPLGRGCRNHCPSCLYSKHVDDTVPGDRLSKCGGLMKPIRLEKGSRKGYMGFDIIHYCERCDKKIKNMLAEDDDFEKFCKNTHL